MRGGFFKGCIITVLRKCGVGEACPGQDGTGQDSSERLCGREGMAVNMDGTWDMGHATWEAHSVHGQEDHDDDHSLPLR